MYLIPFISIQYNDKGIRPEIVGRWDVIGFPSATVYENVLMGHFVIRSVEKGSQTSYLSDGYRELRVNLDTVTCGRSTV